MGRDLLLDLKPGDKLPIYQQNTRSSSEFQVKTGRWDLFGSPENRLSPPPECHREQELRGRNFRQNRQNPVFCLFRPDFPGYYLSASQGSRESVQY